MQNRIPALDGALNFRDLGGYGTRDGRSVRWHMLYRSGTTHAMTPGDLAVLQARRIRYAYDLRSNSERRHRPTRLTAIAELIYRYREHDQLPGDIEQLLTSPHTGPQESRQVMLTLYRQLPYEFADAFRSLFHHLAQGELPLIFNCSAGKDRTGVAAALILTALGVSRDLVLEDYLLTEQFFERSCEMILSDTKAFFLKDIDRTVWEPLMRVHADYLNAMFDRVIATHGSVERYFTDRLGADEALLRRMRDNLLE